MDDELVALETGVGEIGPLFLPFEFGDNADTLEDDCDW